jgi:hypothetical protein
VNRAKSHDEQGCQKVIHIVKNKYDPHILTKVMQNIKNHSYATPRVQNYHTTWKGDTVFLAST